MATRWADTTDEENEDYETTPHEEPSMKPQEVSWVDARSILVVIYWKLACLLTDTHIYLS
jgi:hypothetical protein